MEPTSGLDQLVSAVNISGASSSITTLMVGFIGIGLVFFGYKLVRKVLNSGV